MNIKKGLGKIKPYSVVKQDFWELKNNVKMKIDWNEEFFVNKNLEFELVKFINSSLYSYYPDVYSNNLNLSISNLHQVSTSNILTFNGSDEALDVICRTFLDINDIVILRNPEYSNFYTFVETSLANIIFFKDKYPFVLDIKKYYEFIKINKPKLVYISNPNNPTGLLYPFDFIISLVIDFPNTLFIIDEAYIHFIDENYDQNSIIKFAPLYENLIVTRTFSKMYSLAGLRIGYLVCSLNNIKHLSIIRKGKNVSMLAQVAALNALKYQNFYTEKKRVILEQKLKVISTCKELFFITKVFPSETNFISLEIAPEYFIPLTKYLYTAGIYIRDRSNIEQLDNIIRITIIENMDLFINTLKIFQSYLL
jgi:histidinol-phosphate aminotransferase